MNLIWSPKGHVPVPVITPGVHVIEILSIQEGRTPKRSLFILKIKASVLGQAVTFGLIWGANPAVDRRNGQIVARLHEIAALPLCESPNWRRLAEELAGVPLEVKLGLTAERQEPQLHLVMGEAEMPEVHSSVIEENAPDYIPDDWDELDPNRADAGGARG